MELVYSLGSPEGSACALVASYALPSGHIHLSCLGPHASKAASEPLCLYTPEGELKDPMTIIRYLCEKSDSRATLLGPEKDPADQAAVMQWLTFCASRGFAVSSSSDLSEFNGALQHNTFLCGHHLTAGDLVAVSSLHAAMCVFIAKSQARGFVGVCCACNAQKKASQRELLLVNNVTRWFNHMQNLPGIRDRRTQDFLPIELPTSAAEDIIKAAKEMQQKQGQQQKQQQQQQQQHQAKGSDDKKKAGAAEKPQKAAANTPQTEERPIDDPMRLELRVGLVKKVWRHPEADKLYCEEIDFGPLGVRQIASGLVPHLPQEQFEGQKVVVLFNLKAKPLRGFNSHGMVMCAGTEDRSVVELISPPPDTPLGERVVVEGMSGEADEVLSSKKGKDPLAAVSPFLRTKDDLGCYFKDSRLVTPQGPVRCKSVKCGYIS